jgi:DNA-binding transcriptional regulator YhcF (GntR family)
MIESSALDITVDRDAEIPIGVQLAWALRTRIRDGRFKPRQRLPGMREVAEATGVNVNTVRAVYQRLEQEGLIDSQQGSGTFVASTPQRPSAVATIAADAAREAHETGVDPREVAAALYVSRGSSAPPADEEAKRRRLLRQQIAALERTLVELEAKHPGVAPSSTHTRAGIGPVLLDAVELEHVRSMLVRRLSIVQGAIDKLGSDERVGEGERAGVTERASARKRKVAARKAAPRQAAPAGSHRAAPAGKRAAAARARPTLRPAPEGV